MNKVLKFTCSTMSLAVAGVLFSVATQASAAVIIDPTTLSVVSSGDTTVGSQTFNWETGACTSCDPDTTYYAITPNANLGADGISAITGDTVSLLYKDNVGGSEEGSFAGSYDTTYTPSAEPEDALIEYLMGMPAIADAGWLEVKDGNQDPATYLFDISTWNGTDDISMLNFWPDEGSISHVAIWGTDRVQVPEPHTVALLGLGLLAAGFARRRRGG